MYMEKEPFFPSIARINSILLAYIYLDKSPADKGCWAVTSRS